MTELIPPDGAGPDVTELPPIPALPAVAPGAIERLRTRLVAAADAEGVLDVAYTVVESPVGDLLLAATERGLLRVVFAVEDHDRILEDLARRVSPRVLRAPRRLDPAARQFGEYFDGRRHRFDLSFDYTLSSGFRRRVLGRLLDIGYGETATYAAVATAAGSPRAVRAVGTACATNPLPVAIPCHRVVRSDGTTGGYVGGAAAKMFLLTMEGAV